MISRSLISNQKRNTEAEQPISIIVLPHTYRSWEIQRREHFGVLEVQVEVTLFLARTNTVALRL